MSYMDQAIAYYEAKRAGKSPQEAFAIAFPDGIPTREDALKEQAKAQQKAGLGAVGGTLAGVLATKAVADAVAGEPILGGILGGGSSAGTAAGTGAAVAEAGGAIPGTVAGETAVTGGLPSLGSSGAGATTAEAGGALGGGSTLGAVVPPVGAALGAALVAKGVHDLATGKEDKSTLGLGSRAQTAITTGGLSEVAKFLGLGGFLGHESTGEERARRYDALNDAGIQMHWANNGGDPYAAGGQLREDLAPDFVGMDDSGQWVNNAFAQSRNVSDLRPEDIWGHSAFYEKFGNDWLQNFSEDDRRNIAQGLLDSGRISEGRGQIEIAGDINADLARQQFLGQQPAAQAQQAATQAAQLSPQELKLQEQLGNDLIAALR